MMPILFSMRLAAPIASLSGARIDTGGDSLPVPTRSMIAGIIGAALGIRYDRPQVLQQLQDTMRLVIVVHREGIVIRDYQTVRLGLPHMKGPMWWHDGQQLGVMERELKRIKNARYYLIQSSRETRGHGTTGMARFYKEPLAELLRTAPKRGGQAGG